MKLAMVYSTITTSMAKMTPASGVLKDAAMAAALPQATSERTQLLGTANAWPSRLDAAAPRCTAGPSFPPERPAPSAKTPPQNCRTALRQVIRPWWRANRSMTCDTPVRCKSGGERSRTRPMTKAASSGAKNRSAAVTWKLSEWSSRSSQATASMAYSNSSITPAVARPASTASTASCGSASTLAS